VSSGADGTAADDRGRPLRSLTRHTDYGSTPLDASDLGDDPVAALAGWLADAEREGVYEPNAMVVSTVGADGAPSSRTVLLKGLDGDSLDFVTNHRSRKGRELLANPRIGLLFPWYAMKRQVIVSGSARPAPDEVSDRYFAERPRGSQLGSIASDQSHPIADRDRLEARVAEVEERYRDVDAVPRPAHWGAFRVVPERIEFWQGRTSRLHDRIVFTRRAGSADGWSLERLQP